MSKRRFTTTIDGITYTVDHDGRVYDTTSGPIYGHDRLWNRVTDESLIELVRKRKAARDRRNANARARHEAMTDLGMKRVKGTLGGTYYE